MHRPIVRQNGPLVRANVCNLAVAAQIPTASALLICIRDFAGLCHDANNCIDRTRSPTLRLQPTPQLLHNCWAISAVWAQGQDVKDATQRLYLSRCRHRLPRQNSEAVSEQPFSKAPSPGWQQAASVGNTSRPLPGRGSSGRLLLLPADLAMLATPALSQ